MKIIITEEQKKKLFQIKEGRVKSYERDKIYEDDNWLVVIPLTHNASCKYGAHSKWCVSVKGNETHYNRYMRNGILFYVINKNDGLEKYSYFHSSTKDGVYSKLRGWYDINDNNKSGIPVKGENPFNLPIGVIKSISEYKKDSLSNEEEGINKLNSAGERDGYWEDFYDNGVIQSKGYYNDGYKDGDWEYYDTNGKLRISGFYKNNRKTGVWTIYKDGKVVSSKDYSRNINESFDKKQTLSIIDIDKKGNGLKAIVGNGEGIEGVIGIDEVRGFVNIGFDFTENNKNTSVGAWLKMVSMCPIILGMYLKENDPDLISISTISEQMARIYKSSNFIDLFQHYIGNNYYPLSDRHSNIVFYVNKNTDENKIEDLIDECIKWVERNIRVKKR